ncbi:MAG: tRNA (guanine-N1)-methyltransferase [Methylothermaceae bacteria B42]|nr:MAG: tRNA (guanine-N1)-methyltransferase [Methylothermaceae bacteria B42]HHJ40317.1 tRNA (guanosine(37)-N1)-methyltransferase TrmD [Methylothermaceae bacterium]
MRFDIVTLFPEMIEHASGFGVTGRAIERKLVALKTWNPRDYTEDRHRTVDDRPFGGGPGMVMKVKPLRDAIQAAKVDSEIPGRILYLSPQGKRLEQKDIARLAGENRLILVAGRYEGIDERLLETVIEEEWSIGDYVLSGGELPALVMMDAIIRLLPGVLHDPQSAEQDSYVAGLLDHPHYTRPEVIEGMKVPDILLSGNHQAIARWRMKQALGRTWQRRPDLLAKVTLSAEQQQLLDEFRSELKQGDFKR